MEEAKARTQQAEGRTEQAIQASEIRYRRLFETAQEGILMLDAEKGVLRPSQSVVIYSPPGILL